MQILPEKKAYGVDHLTVTIHYWTFTNFNQCLMCKNYFKPWHRTGHQTHSQLSHKWMSQLYTDIQVLFYFLLLFLKLLLHSFFKNRNKTHFNGKYFYICQKKVWINETWNKQCVEQCYTYTHQCANNLLRP